MGLLVVILLIVAALLALLDIVLPYARGAGARAFWLTPWAVILIVAALFVAGVGHLG